MSSFTYLLLFLHSESPTPLCPFPISSESFHYLSFLSITPSLHAMFVSNLSCSLIFSIPSLSRSLVARAQSVLNCHYPLFQPSFPYSPFPIHLSLFITFIIHHCFSGSLSFPSVFLYPTLLFWSSLSLPASLPPKFYVFGFLPLVCLVLCHRPSFLPPRQRLRLLNSSTIPQMTQSTPHHQPYLVSQSGAMSSSSSKLN